MSRAGAFKALLLGTSLLAASPGMAQDGASRSAKGVDRLSHIVVLYLENRSFDNLFGEFPGANGLSQAGDAAIQRDRDGKPFETLPSIAKPFDRPENPPELRAVANLEGLPNRPFPAVGVRPGVTAAAHTRDLIHAFYTNRTQIHGGKNDLFAAYSDAKALSMSYYGSADMKDTAIWRLARDHTLLDNFFMGAFGGSFLNHIWLVCSCAPSWPDPPNSQRSQVDEEGRVVAERRVTAKSDGDYAVNTTQSIFLNNGRQGENVLPPQRAVTIGDRLTEKGVPWVWYSGGWSVAAKSDRTPDEDKLLQSQSFQWHHQPFAYFARFDPTTQKGRDERTEHLRDASTLEADIKSGALPPVTFYKPIGVLNQHPGYANLVPADQEVARIVRLMEESPMKDSFAVVITYDENGGFFDHVAPPQGPAAGSKADFFGPGTRVPTIVVSPFARKGQVDHTSYDTTSILKFIGERHRLDPLPSARYGAVESLAKAFDFNR
jgi:phospholipase C